MWFSIDKMDKQDNASQGGVEMNWYLLLIALVIALAAALIVVHINYISTKREYLNSLNINNTLIEISNQLTQFKDIDELYKRMLEYTIKLIKGAQYGSILIYDKLNGHMKFGSLIGYDINDFANPHFKKEELFLYTLNKLTEPGIIINPLSQNRHLYNPYENELLKNSKQLIYKSVLSAPLYIDGEFFGCVCVDNIETTTAFTKKDIEMIRYISVHMEIVIKNMLLMDGIKQRLITDSLTGLFNRRYYNSLLEGDFSSKDNPNTSFVMIDMDNFKTINDTYGHIKGDEVLKYFSELLRSRFRKTDTIIRFAGDEFLLILKDCEEKDAEKLLLEIEKELINNPFQGIKIEFSYGISRFDDSSNSEEAIKRADIAMYRRKAAKKQIV